LTLIGLVNSAIGAYYYLRIIVVMYMKEPREDAPAVAPIPLGLGAALAISLAATIYLGVLPGKVLDCASRSAAELLH
jgi:NADH-quinone oxidoreductase subunit N